MKIIRFNCCGMDVHKNTVVATIGITDKDIQITKYIQETFSTLNTDLLRLKQWLIDHDCFEACMESHLQHLRRYDQSLFDSSQIC